jgi:hypothetical protein
LSQAGLPRPGQAPGARRRWPKAGYRQREGDVGNRSATGRPEDRLQVELLRVAVEDPLHPPGQVPSSTRGERRVEHVDLVIIGPVPPDVESRWFRRLRGRVDGPRAAARLEPDPVSLEQVRSRLIPQSQGHHARVVQCDHDAVAGRDDREPAALRVVEVDVDEARC